MTFLLISLTPSFLVTQFKITQAHCFIQRLGFDWFLDAASLVAQMVKNLPAMQETWVWPLRWDLWEDPLEEGMAIHSIILVWRILWTEEPGGLQSMGLQSRTRPSDLTFTLDVLGAPGLTLLVCSCPFPPFSRTFILLFVLKKCGLDALNKFSSAPAPETLRSGELGLYPPRPQLRVGRFLSFWEAPCFYLYNGPDDSPYLTGL